ncbi:MAG: hypothetical protein V1904_10590 [Bacteroidota bacterium]
MPEKAQNGGMWAYLDASGVLEKGTEEEIKAAKKAYRKQYLLNFKRKQRTSKPEFAVNLSKDNGEYSRISSTAKTHKTSIPAFLRMATLAYISKTYIVPDRLLVARLEQLLSQCLNEIQLIVKQKEKYFWGKEEKFKDIEKRIEKLEFEINEVFQQPPTIVELVIREINKKPELKGQLLTILFSSQ